MIDTKNTLLVLGASGMLGNAVLRLFSESNFNVYGTIRSSSSLKYIPSELHQLLIPNIDASNFNSIRKLLNSINPDVVVNCIGVVKQLEDVNDPLVTIPINSLLPHQIARHCLEKDARLIHMSTDCLFTGNKGMYKEDDIPDAQDMYGITKRLGEVDCINTITLRTSIIGHELNGNRSLINWFLSQEKEVKGFTRAIFSGLPTVEIAKIIRDFVLPNQNLRGVYHLSANPISKYDLLKLVAKVYQKDIKIIESNDCIIDRSLDSSKFKKETGYNPKPWIELVQLMKEFG